MDPRLESAQAALTTDPADSLRQADALRAEPGDLPVAVIHRLRGQALRALARHTEAVDAFSEAAGHASAAGDPLLAAQVRIGSVDSLGMLGRFDDAERLARELERELRTAGADETAGKVLYNLGALFYRQDRYADALACYARAEEDFARSANAAQLLPHVQANRALALTFLDRTDEALALYRQAHGTFLARGSALEAATVDANIGFLHAVSGRYIEALAAMNRARETFRAHARPHETARYEIDAGDAYRALNLLPEARACYDRALEIFAQTPLEYDEARAHLGRAATLDPGVDGEAINAALVRAETIFRRQRIGPQRAHVQLLRAYQAGSFGAALARHARRAFARAGLAGWAAEADFVALATEPSLSVRRLHRIRRTAGRTGRGWLECRALHALGVHYRARGASARALGYLRAAAESLEQVRTHLTQEELHAAFLSDKLAVHEDLVAMLLERGGDADIAEAFEQVERVRSRMLLERVLATVPDGALPAALQGRLADLRARISRAYHREVALGQSEARRLDVADSVELGALEGEYRRLLRDAEIAQSVRRSDSLVPWVTIQAIQSHLSPDQCLIEYFAVRGALGAFVLTRGRIQVHAPLCTLADLESDLRRLRFHLQGAALDPRASSASVRATQRVLEQTYRRVLAPLLDGLPEAADRLTIVPHGPLHQLPFHALHDGAVYLVDRLLVNVLPSAGLRDMLSSSGRAATGPALLMGVPDAGIPHVEREIAALSAALPGASAYCGPCATLEVFLARAAESRLIHLATHGLFRSDNPLFSGLRFADGWLLARDLYGLRLDAELVTLSACRSGVVDVAPGQELFGLVRGFLAAGARRLLVSHWPADDMATTDLMSTFYRSLGQGRSVSEALRDAQRDVRGRFPHPYHWAPFFLIGAP